MVEAAHTVGLFKQIQQLCELDSLCVIRGSIVVVTSEYLVGEPKSLQHGLKCSCEDSTCVRLESC